jgi:hypothetical protein
MKIIENNPFRIIGILSNSSEKELQKQKSKITKYASIGKAIDSEYDFEFLGKVDRSESSISKSFSSVEQNQDKVIHSLFWFIKACAFDETAINYLINGDREKAIEIWEKVTISKEVTAKNYSCFNNIGTLKLLGKSKEEIKDGIEAKIKLIESPSFEEFVHTVADQTYTIDNQKQVEKFVNEILIQFKGKYSVNDTFKLFSNCNSTIQKYLTQKFTEEPLHNIEKQVESTRNSRKIKTRDTYKTGLELYENCKVDLATLKSLLGINDLRYKMIADNLAKEIMQCGIDYFLEWKETKDPTEEGLTLLNHAKSIAIGSQILEKIGSNIEGIEDFKVKEISQALDLLQSIKDAFETNKKKITAEVLAMPLGYNQSINWTKVNQLIDNSIDWNKVVELIQKVIPPLNIQKIKQSDKKKLDKFKSLVEFLFSKLSYTQVNKVKYLSYWNTDNTISNINFTWNNLPDWAKWLIGIVIFLVLVGMIWGQEGLGVVFSISFFVGILFLIGWLRSQ